MRFPRYLPPMRETPVMFIPEIHTQNYSNLLLITSSEARTCGIQCFSDSQGHSFTVMTMFLPEARVSILNQAKKKKKVKNKRKSLEKKSNGKLWLFGA